MRVTKLVSVFRDCQTVKFSRFWCHTAAADSDGNIASAVERVNGIGEGGGIFVVFCNCNGQKFAFSPRLQRVDHAQRQNIIHVVADVRIKDQRYCRLWFAGSQVRMQKQ